MSAKSLSNFVAISLATKKINLYQLLVRPHIAFAVLRRLDAAYCYRPSSLVCLSVSRSV